jgi:PIN domain
MTITHILVDFENVQPSAADIGLVRGKNLRLAIFRGPGQMKYAADVAEAWQPLGANVTFIRCAKAGRNASDMHIAFYLGELAAAQAHTGSEGARFVIVSRDTDFDPLLLHIRGLGYEATRVASIRAALGAKGAEAAEPKSTRSRAQRGAPDATATAKPAAVKSAAKKAARKAPAKKAAAAALVTRSAAAIPTAARSQITADALSKVIESLQRMGEKRPGKRKGLERHVESHLGRNLAPGQLDASLQRLEHDGVLVFNDGKVDYRLPKSKR